VEADLAEAFAQRAIRDGRVLASVRYLADVLSVWRWNPSGARLFRDAAQDLAYGLRVFRRSPGAVAITIGGLALAIGVSTAVFGLLNATLLMPLGIADPDSAFRVHRAWSGGVSHSWAYGDYLVLRDMSRETRVEAMGLLRDAAWFTRAAPTIYDTPQQVPVETVSGTFMETFGARPHYGRLLSPADEPPGAPAVAVLGHTFWVRHFGADPTIVGRLVWLSGKPVEIVGVTDRSFTGLNTYPPAFWMTFNGYGTLYSSTSLTATSRRSITVVARKPAAMTAAQAEARLGALAAALGRERADQYRSTGARFEPADQRFAGGSARAVVLIVTSVLVAVALVVLLACVNVASLQLASAFARQREIGVRLALGASRARVFRQLVTESLALGWAAGAGGLALAIWITPLLANALGLPETSDVSPDARVYAFLVLVACAAGIGAGLAPARAGVRGDLLTPLKGDGALLSGAARPRRVRGTLIGIQAAASVMLLVVAVLTARGAVHASRIDVGFEPDGLIVAAVGSPSKAYLDVALERLRSVPGVQAAALADSPPFSGGYIGMELNRDGQRRRAFLCRTDASYFATLGVRVIQGRIYTPAEIASDAPVAVISQSTARHLWGAEDPIGRVMTEFAPLDKTPVTVVGVVSDVVPARLAELRTAAAYRPLTRYQTARILIRAKTRPEGVLPALRAALQPIDPRVQVNLSLVNDRLQLELDQPRTLASMAGAVAGLALMLAVIGIYGVTAFVTGLRRREVGVRLAVGASRADVLRLLLADSFRPIAIGLACGLGAAALAARAFRGAMYGLTAHDPASFAAAALILLAAALAAVYVPTRRASRLDPASVLRQS
jgi:predicted permease